MARKAENFLADAVKANHTKVLGYRDGFRFGVGFMIATLFVWSILGALCWAAVALMQLM